MFRPSGLGPDGDDLRARPAQRLRREAVGRAVRAVGHDPQARQRRLRLVRQRGQQVVQVPLVLGAGVADPAELRGGRPPPPARQPGLDIVFHRVRQLDPAAAEELDPVVPGRVVARRDDHAEGGVQGPGQVGHAGRGDDPEPEHVDPGAGQPGHHGRLEELARGARIPAHHGHRAPGRARAAPPCTENGGRGHAEIHGQARGQFMTSDPPDTVRTEKTATLPRFSHFAPLAALLVVRWRVASTGSARAALTAWSTAVPSGPSSGRTSCAP